MARGIKYDLLNDNAPKAAIECSDGAVLTFWFSKDVRRRSFMRRQADYRDQVKTVVNARYRGIYLETDELALIDLYTRIETEARRMEIVDVFGVTRELSVNVKLTISARLK